MPHLYKEMVKTNKLKICFITAFDIQKEDFQGISINHKSITIIQKPILIKDLVQKLKEQI